ncbi:PilW family protein [Desulfofalx alkaliphila]|uniref:PilW family protein n=1 Tax=Desulfofalx alkaliphila TaxID=105483 RepID=UPI0004E0EE9A|nr:type II secretion system protein [Desulfofalx alkaliphila]
MLRGRNQQGYTLLELMLVITLLSIIMTAVFKFMLQGSAMWWQGQRQIDVQENLSIALDKISRELRNCDKLLFVNSTAGFQPDLDSQILCFYFDYKTVSYYVDDKKQLCRTFGSGLPVSSHVKELKLEYFNSDGPIAPGTQAHAVDRVEITLVGSGEGTPDLVLTTSVAIRTFDN